MFKIQCQIIKPITKIGLMQFTKKSRRYMDKTSKKFTHTIKVHYTQINNRQRLAETIRENFGLGCFNVLFYNYYQRNKSFSKRFECIGKSCKHYKAGKCKVFIRHRKGWSCLANPKFRPNWCVRARLRIIPLYENELHNRDFRISWDKKRDYMRYFFFWKN